MFSLDLHVCCCSVDTSDPVCLLILKHRKHQRSLLNAISISQWSTSYKTGKKKQFKSVPCQPRFIVHLAQQTIQGWIKRSKCVHIGGQILIAPSFCSACSLLKIHVHIKMITIMKYQTTTGSSWITNVTASWCTASHRSMSMKLEMKLLISVLVCSLACVSTDNTYHSC